MRLLALILFSISPFVVLGCNKHNTISSLKGSDSKKTSRYLGNRDSGVGISINDSGDWVVAGPYGDVFENGKKVAEVGYLGNRDSGVGISINDSGDWVVAGPYGHVFKNGKKHIKN